MTTHLLPRISILHQETEFVDAFVIGGHFGLDRGYPDLTRADRERIGTTLHGGSTPFSPEGSLIPMDTYSAMMPSESQEDTCIVSGTNYQDCPVPWIRSYAPL